MLSLYNRMLGTTSIAFLVAHAGLLSAQTQIEAWVTNPDRSSLFQKAAETIPFRASPARGPVIVIDPAQQMQSIDGFGYALTGGSAELLVKMTPEARARILRQIFASDGNNLGVSYLRTTIGASDLNSVVYSYDDLPAGETDPTLAKFDLGLDRKHVLPILKQILALAPAIKILGSPWSAPAWMKTNGNVRGGALKEECYPAYALYLVKYIQAMHAYPDTTVPEPSPLLTLAAGLSLLEFWRRTRLRFPRTRQATGRHPVSGQPG